MVCVVGNCLSWVCVVDIVRHGFVLWVLSVMGLCLWVLSVMALYCVVIVGHGFVF